MQCAVFSVCVCAGSELINQLVVPLLDIVCKLLDSHVDMWYHDLRTTTNGGLVHTLYISVHTHENRSSECVLQMSLCI